MKAKKIAYLSLLTAVALIIFIIELRIPNLAPIPGVKLGLANIVTVYALYHFSPGDTALLLTARILLGAVFAGNISALVYSASGAFLCLVGMSVLRRFIDEKHIYIASILGAVLHNIGQTAAAVLMMRTLSVVVYLPFLLVSGCIAGLFTGLCAQVLVNKLKIGEKNEKN